MDNVKYGFFSQKKTLHMISNKYLAGKFKTEYLCITQIYKSEYTKHFYYFVLYKYTNLNMQREYLCIFSFILSLYPMMQPKKKS